MFNSEKLCLCDTLKDEISNAEKTKLLLRRNKAIKKYLWYKAK